MLAALLLLVFSAAQLQAATITLAWDPNPEPDIAGYVVSYGTQSGTYTTSVDVGNVTSWAVNLAGGQRYYFVAQAYNTAAQQSVRSPEIFADVAASSAPSITSLSPTSGVVGAAITISGANFGATQSTSSVRFNGTVATPTSWSANSLAVPVPSGATTGNVVVTVGGVASNGKTFTVAASAPSITTLSPTSGVVGAAITISGANFGATQSTSSVRFNGTVATPTSWSANSLVVPVPSGATTGNVVVTVNSVASNGVPFTVTSSTLPAPWQSLDIGSPALAGQASAASGTFTLSGGGVDIWDVNDQFRFVYQTFDGDGEIVARVDSVQSADPWTKVGVMIREDLAGGSPNAMAETTGANGMAFQSRVSRGGVSTSIKGFAGAAPQWVRLVRSGNTLTGYYSANGTAWTLISNKTVTMAAHVYVGLALTSHNASASASATVSNVTVTAAATNRAPTLTQPANQASSEGSTVSVQLAGSDPDGNPLTYSATGLPASLAVNTTTGMISGTLTFTSAGSYSVTATVSDGTLSNSKTFSWTVADVSQPPTITSLSPTSGAAGAVVTISGATFGASQGTSSVRFNGTVATPSSWNTSSIVAPVPVGATTGIVVVTVGGVASNGVPFTVTDTQAPTAPGTLTSTVVSSSRIDLAWTASTDNVGVTNYRIERCQGAGCATFAQIATTSSTTLSDVGLTAATGYTYRVRATDAAANLSPYSNTSSATTQASTSTPIAFVQANYAAPQTTQATVTVPFLSAQRVGDVNVVVVGWNDAVRQVQAVTDTQGNAYVLAVGPTVYAGVASQAMYYAANVAAAPAGANTVTVTFTSSATSPNVRIAEYSGANAASPLDVTAAAQGATGSSNSGSVTTTAPAALLVAANLVQTGTAAGAGFTLRPAAGAPGVIYVRDTFTAANGTALAAHQPNAGAAWIDDQAGIVIQGNKAESPNFGDARAHNATTPASANYDVQVDLTLVTTGTGNKAGVRGRDAGGRLGDAYEAYFNESTRTWYLDKWKGSNPTNLGTYADPTFTSGTKTLTLRMVGTSIQVFVNGTLRISATDSAIAAANHPGVRGSGGIHNALPLSNYVVQDVSSSSITPFLLEDRNVSAAGAYQATAAVSPAGPWIMQMIVLR